MNRRLIVRILIAEAVAVGLLLVVAAVCGLFFLQDVRHAKAAAADAQDRLRSIQASISGDSDTSLTEAIEALREDAETVRTSTDGPLWAIASHTPKAGVTARAVRTVASVLDDLSGPGLQGFLDTDVPLTVDTLRPKDGKVDLAALAALADPLSRLDEVLDSHADEVAALDPSAVLTSGFRQQLGDFQDLYADAVTLAERADAGLGIALPLLTSGEASGAGTTIGVLFQNNAEVRAQGGLAGAFAVIRVDPDGAIAIVHQGNRYDLDILGSPIVPLTDEELANFHQGIATDFREITGTPDFPRTAQVMSAMFERQFGERLDAVVSADPVALSYVLRGVGDVQVDATHTLTADNLVSTLLNDSYWAGAVPGPNGELDIDDRASDGFFELTASRTFAALLSGAGDVRATFSALSQGVAEHRILLWAADPAVEADIEATPLSGSLVPDTDHPTVGMYLGSYVPSKMQYWLRYTTSLEATSCTSDGRQELLLTATLTNTAPAEATSWPRYIAGYEKYGALGHQGLNVWFLLPSGATLGAVTQDGVGVGLKTAALEGRPTASASISLAPGASTIFTLRITGGTGQTGEPQLNQTPSVVSQANGVRVPSAC